MFLFQAYVCRAGFRNPSAMADIFMCPILFWEIKSCTTLWREYVKSWCYRTINSILPICVPCIMGLQGHLYHSSIHLCSHLTNFCWAPIILRWTRPTPTSKEMVQDSNPELVIALSTLLCCLPLDQLWLHRPGKSYHSHCSTLSLKDAEDLAQYAIHSLIRHSLIHSLYKYTLSAYSLAVFMTDAIPAFTGLVVNVT